MPSRDKRADPPFGRVRIDKWLWAARFYKTRSLAARAVEGGKVKLNGERVKPGKEVKVGDEIERRSGELHWLVEVRGVALKRGPAAEAALLYAEGEARAHDRNAPRRAARGAPHSRPAHQARPAHDPALYGRLSANA